MNYTDARVESLATFQESALRHALTFPSVQHIVYSTCSVHIRENEGVVAAVLDEATQLGFKLGRALPTWHRRGISGAAGLSKEQADYLVRTGWLLYTLSSIDVLLCFLFLHRHNE